MAVLSVDRIPDARASAFSRLNSLNRYKFVPTGVVLRRLQFGEAELPVGGL